ncbi:unnamed protein product [Boreogadus saida]
MGAKIELTSAVAAAVAAGGGGGGGLQSLLKAESLPDEFCGRWRRRRRALSMPVARGAHITCVRAARDMKSHHGDATQRRGVGGWLW